MTKTQQRNGARIPAIMYGTAWKELETERLTALALRSGFRAIDTANQRRHYHEAGVGEAVKRALAEGTITRDALFLQTKFTFRRGQDHRLPYDPNAAPAAQVEQSFASSLEHLGTTYLDSYVLHGPSTGRGLVDQDWQVWRAMERLAQAGKTKLLGVSNVDRAQLEELDRNASIRPTFVQNRCYAHDGWDEEVRAYCRARDLIYQGFSLLTANPQIVGHAEVARIAAGRNFTPAQVVFAFTVQLGILPLTGTTDETHMRQDLEAVNLALSAEEVQTIERLSLIAPRRR